MLTPCFSSEQFQRSIQTPTAAFKRKAVPILLNDMKCLARPDTGSEKNIMTEEFAKQNNIHIHRTETGNDTFKLGSGKQIQSIGRAYVPCCIFGDNSSSEHTWFSVLAKCAVPVIMGMEFIQKIKLYRERKHLLVDCPPGFGNMPTLKWIGSPRAHINFSAGDRSFVGCADTGSDLDFMSLRCARKHGFKIDGGINQRTRVRIADSTIVETVGKVHMPSVKLGPFDPFAMEFHILPGLPSDVIFGEELLDRIDAFNTCAELMDTEDPHQHSLNTLINLGPIQAFMSRTWTPAAGGTAQQEHDHKIEAEIYRRNKARRVISRIVSQDQVEAARATEEAKILAFDTGHIGCAQCVGGRLPRTAQT
jgi:hypothetical protein